MSMHRIIDRIRIFISMLFEQFYYYLVFSTFYNLDLCLCFSLKIYVYVSAFKFHIYVYVYAYPVVDS